MPDDPWDYPCLLDASLGIVRKSAVEVVRGETARRKTLLLKGVSVDHVRAALAGKLPAG